MALLTPCADEARGSCGAQIATLPSPEWAHSGGVSRAGGLNRNYVGMIEREENSPTVDTLEKLAAVLKIEPQLFFVDDELISEAVGLQGSSQSTRKGHPLAREGGGSRRRP